MAAKIPIRNIYYLLCYAWDRVEEKDIVFVDPVEGGNILDLLGQVLARGTAHLLRRGLDRGYVPHSEDSAVLRGRIDFEESSRRLLLQRAQAHVRDDELSYDTLHNQIIRATLLRLVKSGDLAPEIHDQCHDVYRNLEGITPIPLNRRTFRSVQLCRQARFYDFVLRICELVVDNLLPTQDPGTSKFRSFWLDERRMANLFEAFIRNFCRKELTGIRIGTEVIPWNLRPRDVSSAAVLPRMNTDITLETAGKRIVVDCKYYSKTLLEHHEKEMIHPEHLYQLYSYVSNLKVRCPVDRVSGMLIYPTIDRELDARFLGDEIELRAATLNLTGEWQEIHDRIVALVTTTFEDW